MDTKLLDFLVDLAVRLRLALLPIGVDERPLVRDWCDFLGMRASEEQIRQWAEQSPPCWAVVSGPISQAVILEFNGVRGNITMKALGLAPHVRTGDGYHIYMRDPGWPITMFSEQADLAKKYPDVRIRADRGYGIVCGRTIFGQCTLLRELIPNPLESIPDDLRALLGLLKPTTIPDDLRAILGLPKPPKT